MRDPDPALTTAERGGGPGCVDGRPRTRGHMVSKLRCDRPWLIVASITSIHIHICYSLRVGRLVSARYKSGVGQSSKPHAFATGAGQGRARRPSQVASEGRGCEKPLYGALFQFASKLATIRQQKRCSSRPTGVDWSTCRARLEPHWQHRAKTAHGVKGGRYALQFKASAVIQTPVAAVAQW